MQSPGPTPYLRSSKRETVSSFGPGRVVTATSKVVTDDGYQNNYSVAFPILRELALPATIFIVPGFIDTDETFCSVSVWFRNVITSFPRPLGIEVNPTY